jgi:hypothetical protein
VALVTHSTPAPGVCTRSPSFLAFRSAREHILEGCVESEEGQRAAAGTIGNSQHPAGPATVLARTADESVARDQQLRTTSSRLRESP